MNSIAIQDEKLAIKPGIPVVDFTGRAKAVIANHIRSAVLIDDDWPGYVERHNIADALTVANDEPEQEATDESGAEEEIDDVPPILDELKLVEVKADKSEDQTRLLKIQDSLMKRGIICTGFKYTNEDKDSAPKLAKNADIVILDWNFANDEGAGAVGILKKLKDGHLRFICIFTDQPKLVDIKKTIWEEVCELTSPMDDCLDFKAVNFVFTLRNKAVANLDSENTSTEDNLFDHAIEHLSRHYSGLLQLGMLEMTSRHRDTLLSHLLKYSPEFDAALLSEAVQKGSPVDMAENLRALLIDEWRIALESSVQKKEMEVLGDVGLRDYAVNLKAQLPKIGHEFLIACFKALDISYEPKIVEKWFKRNDDQARKFDADLALWLDSGARDAPPWPGTGGPPKKGFTAAKVTVVYLYMLSHSGVTNKEPTREEIYSHIFRLDALFNQQQMIPVEITQGTILKAEGDTYLICITPLCDTARFPKGFNSYSFLGAVKAKESEILVNSPNYCVFVEEGMPICLHVDIKRPYVFEIDDMARHIEPGKMVTIRPRLLPMPELPPSQKMQGMSDSVSPALADVPSHTMPVSVAAIGTTVETTSNDKEGIVAAGGKEDKKNSSGDLVASINLKVVGQLRTDFFLMLTAASASNAARVGVNRVEFIRLHKNQKKADN